MFECSSLVIDGIRFGSISGDGDLRIFLSAQEDTGYQEHLLYEDMPQAGVHMVDTNNDGQLEMLIGSYEQCGVFTTGGRMMIWLLNAASLKRPIIY